MQVKGNLDIYRHELYKENRTKEKSMVDYEEIYVQIMHTLRESGFTNSMSESALLSEKITEIVKKEVEGAISNGTE